VIYKVFVLICSLTAPGCQLLKSEQGYYALNRCMEKAVTAVAEIKKKTPGQAISWCRGFSERTVTNVGP